ncbi:hypothetical protein Hanom_Chr04g00306501 [Helianthus anomalus]
MDLLLKMQGTMKLGRLAKSVATGVNTKRRARGLLHHPCFKTHRTTFSLFAGVNPADMFPFNLVTGSYPFDQLELKYNQNRPCMGKPSDIAIRTKHFQPTQLYPWIGQIKSIMVKVLCSHPLSSYNCLTNGGYLYAKMSIDHHRSLLIYLVSKDAKRKQKMITFSPDSYDFSWSCVCRH